MKPTTPAHAVVGVLARVTLTRLCGNPLVALDEATRAVATVYELISAIQEGNAAREQLRRDDRQPVKDRLAKAEAWLADVLDQCRGFEEPQP